MHLRLRLQALEHAPTHAPADNASKKVKASVIALISFPLGVNKTCSFAAQREAISPLVSENVSLPSTRSVVQARLEAKNKRAAHLHSGKHQIRQLPAEGQDGRPTDADPQRHEVLCVSFTTVATPDDCRLDELVECAEDRERQSSKRTDEGASGTPEALPL